MCQPRRKQRLPASRQCRRRGQEAPRLGQRQETMVPAAATWRTAVTPPLLRPRAAEAAMPRGQWSPAPVRWAPRLECPAWATERQPPATRASPPVAGGRPTTVADAWRMLHAPCPSWPQRTTRQVLARIPLPSPSQPYQPLRRRRLRSRPTRARPGMSSWGGRAALRRRPGQHPRASDSAVARVSVTVPATTQTRPSWRTGAGRHAWPRKVEASPGPPSAWPLTAKPPRRRATSR
mmetsp:Transcript_48498/g.135526  ORF Transcript_48498/g.135526 Transcript_48498/m.135526 type:complete len:235 (+) Transcript_48498:713-1417(+)